MFFAEGELEKSSTVANFATVQNEGSRNIERQIEYYNLDVIISVGYRVHSVRIIKSLTKRNTPRSGNLFQPNGNALGLRKQNIR